MTTTAPATTTPTTTAPTTSGTNGNGTPTALVSSKTLGSDINTFLKLLTTQLKNQDPESPLDTNQLTQQLAQFSQIEQAINTNTNLQTLINLQQGDQAVSALPLVGHTVQYSDSQGALVNGSVEFGYNLPAQASSATMTITDQTGATVFQGPAETTSGDHTFTWDGTGSDGNKLPDGTYTFSVAAQAPDKSAITAAITAFGKVESVKVNSGVGDFVIGSFSDPVTKIVGVDAGS